MKVENERSHQLGASLLAYEGLSDAGVHKLNATAAVSLPLISSGAGALHDNTILVRSDPHASGSEAIVLIGMQLGIGAVEWASSGTSFLPQGTTAMLRLLPVAEQGSIESRLSSTVPQIQGWWA